MSDQAKAEQGARNKLLTAINLLRAGQSILQMAGWEHDPFASVIDEAKNTYAGLQDYTTAPELVR